LRKVGGSVMLAVPPAILDILKLRAGATVGLAVDDGRLVVDPQVRPKYTMNELLALYEPGADDQADREWLDVTPLGSEL
jgi:antitoxin ChpS